MALRPFLSLGKSFALPWMLYTSLTNSLRAQRWTPVSDFNGAYEDHHVQFLRCIIRQVLGHPFHLALPLTSEQKEAFKDLSTLLASPGSSKSELQSSIQLASWEMVRMPSKGSWQNIYQVYFALLALRVDGTYSGATSLTPHLAKFTYWIRLACLYQATSLPDEDSVP